MEGRRRVTDGTPPARLFPLLFLARWLGAIGEVGETIEPRVEADVAAEFDLRAM